MTSRATAALVIDKVLRHGAALDEPLAQALATVPPKDRPLVQQLAYGTLRQSYRLQAILDQVLAKPLKRKDGDIQALLLCGLHQLLDMRTPDHAAISTTVEACRELGKPWATGLVNGVLRRCTREAQALEEAVSASARLNHPPWLIDELKRDWPDHWARIIDAGNQHPPMCLRVNRHRCSRSDYLERLAAAGIAGSPCAIAPLGIRLDTPVDVVRLPGFAEGWVSVQDEAAQLSAPLLQLQAGDRVLDACSAPGGKTGHILESDAQLAGLVAMDISEGRMARVRENLERLGLEAETVIGDARSPSKLWPEQSFDRILVDAPCSGTGVIRRHPDIKILRQYDDIDGFARLQASILDGLWPLLRPGGRLLYVTCSVLPAENNAVVEGFLSATADAEAEELAVDWGLPLGPGRQTLPDREGADGLYFARLVKRKS